MTNLKKTLAVVLAFAMILSMGAISTFAAYSDVEAGTTVSEAVGILSNLDILTGFEDGTFRPDETVTRAQMAAIICRMLGYEDQAQSSMGSTVFTDVAADHWASGYVNVAQAQGIINGMGDGTFAPDAKVTYEQAIKMIVSALGYDLVAARKGGYPTGYLAIASAEGITKKANGKVGDAAARATVAVLVYNALEVQLMDQDSWSSDGDDRYSQTDDTVLSKYLEVEKYEGIVASSPVVDIAANGYEADGDALLSLAPGSVVWSYEDGKVVKTVEALTDVDCSKVDADAYLGKSVIVYVGKNELNDDDMVVAIAENEAKNSSLTISSTQLVEEGDRKWEDDLVIGYREVGDNKIKELDLDEDVVASVNFVEADEDITTTAALAALLEEYVGASIEFISNDADSAYEVISVLAYGNEAVIEEVIEEEGIFTFETFTGDIDEIDTEDEDSRVVVYKDGELATVADLAANDTVVSVVIDDDFIIYYASSATVTGKVDSFDPANEVVTIAGEDYELSAAIGKTVSELNDEEGIFFLNIDGQIAWNETEGKAGNYAVVLAAYETTEGLNGGTYLQVVLADGTLAEYKISDKAKVVGEDGDEEAKNVASNKTAVYDYFTAMLTADDDAFKATVANLQDNTLVVDITIANDKITKIKLVEDGASVPNKKYDADSMSVGSTEFSEETVVFSIKQTEGIVDAEDIVIGKIADFYVDGEALADGEAYAFAAKKDVYAVALGFGLTKSIDTESDLFIVTGKKTTSIDDTAAYILTGYVDGKETKITLYNEDGEYGDDVDAEEISVGDILLLADADAAGYVSEVAVVYDGELAADMADNDDVYWAMGEVDLEKTDANRFYFGATITPDDDDDEAINAATEGLSYKSTATYVLVDYSESNTPEVSKKSGSKSLFSSRYDAEVFVRFVEGKLVDVIVFRYEAE